ncbi:hypothetical protein [Salinisphaera sp. PC39]|uniref:hypothetical protein n=1 Tax=Salinisphaera sp. PC39 TaxID=1304156 RepID=UPI003340A4F3
MNKPDYLAWFLVIAAAVCTGNLASNSISYMAVNQWAAYQLRQFQVQMEERSQRQAVKAREQRAGSPRGQELLRRCREWRRNYTMTPSQTTAAKRDQACEDYHKYVWGR